MKLAIYSPSWPGGATANGITTANVTIVEGLRARGHQVSILTPKAEVEGPEIFALPPLGKTGIVGRIRQRLGHYHLRIPLVADQIASALGAARARHGTEMLVMEETYGLAGMVRARTGIPTVVVLHGPWFLLGPLTPLLERAAINRGRIASEDRTIGMADGVAAPSGFVLDAAMARQGAAAGQPRQVIPNPMPLKPAVDYDAMAPEDRRSLLCVGRVEYLKGADVVLDAFARLVGDGADVRLGFVGPDRGLPGPDGTAESMEARIARLPDAVRARLTWHGLQPKAAIDAMRHRHGVAFMASRFENFPGVVLESMASGVATVATRVGGVPEILRDGETGCLVEPGDAAALASALGGLIADPGRAARLGQAARADIAARFAPDVIAATWERFLTDVQARSAVPAPRDP